LSHDVFLTPGKFTLLEKVSWKNSADANDKDILKTKQAVGGDYNKLSVFLHFTCFFLKKYLVDLPNGNIWRKTILFTQLQLAAHVCAAFAL